MKYGKVFGIAGLLSAVGVVQAHASVTAEVSKGVNVIYDSGSNSTWTADANLLNTLEQQQGFVNLYNAIYAANHGVVYDTPSVYDNGVYHLTQSDFIAFSTPFFTLIDGTADWWGAVAFINYLNSIDYAGSKQWALPYSIVRIPDSSWPGGYRYGPSQFDQLFSGPVANCFAQCSYLTNEKTSGWYWASGQYQYDSSQAWGFSSSVGDNPGYKVEQDWVWAVSPGNVLSSAVSAPATSWLLLPGLAGLAGYWRRRREA